MEIHEPMCGGVLAAQNHNGKIEDYCLLDSVMHILDRKRKIKICMYMLIFQKNKHRKDKPKTSGSQDIKQREIFCIQKLGTKL